MLLLNSWTKHIMRFITFITALALSFSGAIAQERQWSLVASDQEAYLVFGVPDTDDVGLSFWCKIGTGKISIFAPIDKSLVKRNKRTKVKLEIDDNVFPIKMKAEVIKTAKSASLEGPVSISGTVMAAASHGQDFAFTAYGHRSSYPLIDADVSGLLQTCAGAATG